MLIIKYNYHTIVGSLGLVSKTNMNAHSGSPASCKMEKENKVETTPKCSCRPEGGKCTKTNTKFIAISYFVWSPEAGSLL